MATLTTAPGQTAAAPAPRQHEQAELPEASLEDPGTQEPAGMLANAIVKEMLQAQIDIVDEAGHTEESMTILGCGQASLGARQTGGYLYQIAIAQSGTYFFHARTLAHSTSDDSIWYGVDGVPDQTAKNLTHDGTWHWTAGDSFNLGVGLHTLHVWQREAGARVDVVALTTTSTPPP